MGASLELIDVTRTYRRGDQEIPVLLGIDLSIAPSERVAIMGRSGSGKSTLLNLIGCLDVPTSGRYLLNGREVSAFTDDELSAQRLSSIGFVFQTFHLLPSMTIHENVALPMEYARVPLDEQRERAAELLSLVGLSHRLEHTPHELSGGERQRVAIARALANRPQLLIADEPTGALDSKAQDVILSLFADVHQRFQTTMVVVTHDERVAQTMGDRVLHMSDGRFLP